MPADAEQQLARQRALRTLLERTRLTTQADVIAALEARGHDVTQSSVSRDLKELGAVKIDGAYRVPAPVGEDTDEVQRTTFRLILGADPAGDNLLVVRTPAGAAQIVAAALDALTLSDIVGTLAGDDTLFIATAGRAQQKRVVATLDALRSGGPS